MQRRTPPFARRLVFAGLTLALVVIACELLSLVVVSVTQRRVTTPARLRTQIIGTVISRSEMGLDDEVADWADWANMFAIHPYVGYVLDRGFEYQPRLDHGGPDAVNFGFSLDEPGVFFEPDPRTMVVAVTGGSVAFNVSLRFGDHIRDVVERSLATEFDRVIVVNLAIPGHHQPQQLLLINYLLTLGVHFDVVVNLDGFNEIALAPEENLSKGVAAFFPYAWYYKIADFGAEHRVRIAKMTLLEGRRRALAGFFTRPPLRWSNTAGALWLLLDGRAVRQMVAIDNDLVQQRGRGQTRYIVTGPREVYSDRTAILQRSAEIWYHSSQQLNATCEATGSRYFHFLQPNQYVTGSKPMSDEERQSVVRWEQPFAAYVRDGYPLLSSYGRQLREQDIRFHDLTMLFQHTTGPTYGDDCCHFNSLGDQMLAQAIGDAIVDDFRTNKVRGLGK